MSLMFLAVEYLILHTIFETIHQNDVKILEKQSDNLNTLNIWTPLPDYEIYNIRKLTE